MNNETKDKGKKKSHKWLFFFIAVVAIVVGLSWPTNYYLEMPGEAFQVSQFIRSGKKAPNNYYLVTVSETQRPASVLRYL